MHFRCIIFIYIVHVLYVPSINPRHKLLELHIFFRFNVTITLIFVAVVTGTMALVSADTKIAELLNELHQLIKQTQVTTLFGLYEMGNIHFIYFCGSYLCKIPCYTLISQKNRRSGQEVNTIFSTSRRHMKGCRQKIRVRHCSMLCALQWAFSNYIKHAIV